MWAHEGPERLSDGEPGGVCGRPRGKGGVPVLQDLLGVMLKKAAVGFPGFQPRRRPGAADFLSLLPSRYGHGCAGHGSQSFPPTPRHLFCLLCPQKGPRAGT